MLSGAARALCREGLHSYSVVVVVAVVVIVVVVVVVAVVAVVMVMVDLKDSGVPGG